VGILAAAEPGATGKSGHDLTAENAEHAEAMRNPWPKSTAKNENKEGKRKTGS
jgi:hypothetical protein